MNENKTKYNFKMAEKGSWGRVPVVGTDISLEPRFCFLKQSVRTAAGVLGEEARYRE